MINIFKFKNSRELLFITVLLLTFIETVLCQSNKHIQVIETIEKDTVSAPIKRKLTGLIFEFAVDPMTSFAKTKGSFKRGTSFHYNVGIGYERDRIRISSIYSSHKHIDYTKFTYIKVDYKLFELDKVNLLVGVEMSYIYRKKETNSSLGINLEAGIDISRRINIGLRWNTFLAEDMLIDDGKGLRNEGFILLHYKI